MNKENKPTINQNSRISVQRTIDGSEYIGDDGKTYIKTRWEVLDKPINFGSCAKKKNTDVIAMKIEIPEDKPKNIFSGLFGDN